MSTVILVSKVARIVLSVASCFLFLSSCNDGPRMVVVETSDAPAATSSIEGKTPAPNSLATASENGTVESTTSVKYRAWSPLLLTFEGPLSQVGPGRPNPFRIDFWVNFKGPQGQAYRVPGFFAGDGGESFSGTIWQVRFTPDQQGPWTYWTESDSPLLDQLKGEFKVEPVPDCPEYLPGSLPDFQCQGRLVYGGGRYLTLSDGTTWLKGGADDPEDFLAEGQTAGLPSKAAAIDFLADHGINSMYLLLDNLGGDAQNIWPWLGDSQREARQRTELFDIRRLNQWEVTFNQIEDRGIALHLVLEDDSGWTGFNRRLYYREMVARFGHHNGLIWNISEEYNENYTAPEIIEFAALLAELDPYDHPIAVHHSGGTSNWEPFIPDENITVTSFQTGRAPQNASAVSWLDTLIRSSRPKVISFDETGKLSSRHRLIARHIVWSIYLGGANYEMHMSPLISFNEYSDLFDDLTRARSYLEDFPFCRMLPDNEAMVLGKGYVLSRPGEAYIVYLPSGGEVGLDLRGAAVEFVGQWFDPASGKVSDPLSLDGGSTVKLVSPFAADSVLGLRKVETPLPGCY